MAKGYLYLKSNYNRGIYVPGTYTQTVTCNLDRINKHNLKTNKMRHSYAREKIGAAIESMATNRGDIKIRLWGAYLIFHTLKEDDFPEDLKEYWNSIYNDLTTEEPSYGANGEVTDGRVQNTLKVIDEDKCVEIAKKISELNALLR